MRVANGKSESLKASNITNDSTVAGAKVSDALTGLKSNLNDKVSKAGDTMSGNLTVKTSGGSSRVEAQTGTDNKASLYSNAEGGNLRLEKGLAHAEMDTNSMNSAGTGAVRLYLNDGTATEVTKQFLFRQDGSFVDGNGVNTGTLNSGKVSKSGDTMTGDLLLSDAPAIVQDTRITSGTTPSSNIYGRAFYLNDSQRFNIGTWQIMSLANGHDGFQLVGAKKVNNVNKFNYMRLLVDANGDPVVELSNPATWRKALGIEPYSINNGVATFTEDITGTNTRIIIKNRTVIVNYQGESKTHAAGDTLFTFNSGYRPAYLFYVPFVCNNTGYGVLSVNTDGAVKVSTINGGETAGRIYAQFNFPLP